MNVELAIVAIVSYLAGSIPFGYVIGRLRGVNLFEVGSGNIGATNVGRVLGAKLGVLCFVVDLAKGIVPVVVVSRMFNGEVPAVIAAAAAFLGHLFPLFLGFRGGKGVATGAGTVVVLAPLPALAAVGAFALSLVCTRIVSLSSIIAAVVVSSLQLSFSSSITSPVCLYCLLGTLVVILKHRGNIVRLIHGNENQIGDGPMRQNLVRVMHVFAVGLWCGGAAFFNFATAPALFRSFEEVVATAPSDRTAMVAIVPPGTSDVSRKNLASALAGAGVGPVFAIYFPFMTICAVVALATALVWRRHGRMHRLRVLIAIAALATVLAGWPIAHTVSELRLARFSADADIAAAARTAFGPWHVVSLALSMLSVLLSALLLVLAALLPSRPADGIEQSSMA